MKEVWKAFLASIPYFVFLVISLPDGGLSPFGGNTVLNTKKIDRNIEKLRRFSWFNNLYEDEKYRPSFFANRKVRGYLQSSIRVNRMMKHEYAQKRFLAVLEKQVQLRDIH